jgi:hypothetical protein
LPPPYPEHHVVVRPLCCWVLPAFATATAYYWYCMLLGAAWRLCVCPCGWCELAGYAVAIKQPPGRFKMTTFVVHFPGGLANVWPGCSLSVCGSPVGDYRRCLSFFANLSLFCWALVRFGGGGGRSIARDYTLLGKKLPFARLEITFCWAVDYLLPGNRLL